MTASAPPTAPPTIAPVFDLLTGVSLALLSVGLLTEAVSEAETNDESVGLGVAMMEVWLDAETISLAKPSLSQFGYRGLAVGKQSSYEILIQEHTS